MICQKVSCAFYVWMKLYLINKSLLVKFSVCCRHHPTAPNRVNKERDRTRVPHRRQFSLYKWLTFNGKFEIFKLFKQKLDKIQIKLHSLGTVTNSARKPLVPTVPVTYLPTWQSAKVISRTIPTWRKHQAEFFWEDAQAYMAKIVQTWSAVQSWPVEVISVQFLYRYNWNVA